MPARLRLLQYPRRLRVRLIFVYIVLFSVFLSLIGVVFREVLRNTLDQTMRAVLEEEWGAAKGYVQIRKGRLTWFYDKLDPDEALFVARLQHVYLLTNDQGRPLGVSPIYQSFGIDSADQIRQVIRSNKAMWSVRWSEDGLPYLVRSGVLIDDGNRNFFLAIGRPIDQNQRTLDDFTRQYFLAMPAFLLVSLLLGWLLTGRALKPVNDLAQTAQRISGSSLDVRIPLRGAHDELDRLSEAFNRMMERLESSFAQIRQFSTDVSHELRTPLTAIRGQLEVALFTAQTPEQYRDAMLNAMQDVERLSAIVKSLLLLSQAESGRLLLQKARQDICPSIRDLVDQFQIPADEQRVSLTADLPPECTVEVDRVQFERLVANLLSNAVKYTPAGGKVSVRLADQGETVLLEVSDTGQGIPEASLPFIFERFYRVQPNDPAPEKGLGLGLSFVAWIVKAHNGSIDVKSKVGEGTAILVTLPKGATPGERAGQTETGIPAG
jgi:heavy metal sensor kinase